MTDRELLEKLANFLNGMTFIEGDMSSIRDMIARYGNPPLTLHNRVAMRMSVNEYKQFQALMQRVNGYLKPETGEMAGGIKVQWPPKSLEELGSEDTPK